ncbi:hypothetical protein Y032_0059g3044 [Ancylostoma ceylanicum]|uniref:Uncharacterized protein n=1 Tax=Ancylostoma ceylanicum TaxID=53326 RepID=A0A016U386_9BILA|nr:hypothetical protein Y032_0059g3044 [Ancylostoma ceylanicum]
MGMLCLIAFMGPPSELFSSVYGASATLLFSLKSFNSTVAMICTTACYRSHFASKTGISIILTTCGYKKAGQLFVSNRRSLATTSS